MSERIYDLAIIGGGINGCGIAADAAGRGLSVVLAEQGDLACGTSSASSKLIHGGLRYLEQFEFRLVREALAEREVLLAKAGHIVWPLRFVLPAVPGGRSELMLRAGLFLYDHLGARRLIPGSSRIDLSREPAGEALRPELKSGFTYWDCWVDDARLVVLNARAAADKGAEILTRARVTSFAPESGRWCVRITADGTERKVQARAIVNAAGPWVPAISGRNSIAAPPVRLVKGSHIVVPRITTVTDAYLLQSPDGRVVFALPYEEHFTLIGTTDISFSGDPASVAISEDETEYLLSAANRFLNLPLSKADIVWTFSGVRSLYDDQSDAPSAITRDYRLELDAGAGGPPVLTVLGGKITTYRKLAEAALDRLRRHLPRMRRRWTAKAPLPGGDLGAAGFAGYLHALASRRPGFDIVTLKRLARRYGTRTDELLGDAKAPADLGAVAGAGLSEREVLFLKETEWARTPDDILWRRTKAGLHMSVDERQRAEEVIAKWL